MTLHCNALRKPNLAADFAAVMADRAGAREK